MLCVVLESMYANFVIFVQDMTELKKLNRKPIVVCIYYFTVMACFIFAGERSEVYRLMYVVAVLPRDAAVSRFLKTNVELSVTNSVKTWRGHVFSRRLTPHGLATYNLPTPRPASPPLCPFCHRCASRSAPSIKWATHLCQSSSLCTAVGSASSCR